MNTRYLKYLLLSATLATPALASAAGDNSTRRERNFIVEGNKLYHDERYADAEVAYRKALEIDAMNEIAQFNLAATLLRQGTATGENEKQASQILGKLATDAEDVAIAEKAFYNLGNIAFNAQDYAKSIELYKNALRRNPDNDKARENLRLAQNVCKTSRTRIRIRTRTSRTRIKTRTRIKIKIRIKIKTKIRIKTKTRTKTKTNSSNNSLRTRNNSLRTRNNSPSSNASRA